MLFFSLLRSWCPSALVVKEIKEKEESSALLWNSRWILKISLSASFVAEMDREDERERWRQVPALALGKTPPWTTCTLIFTINRWCLMADENYFVIKVFSFKFKFFKLVNGFLHSHNAICIPPNSCSRVIYVACVGPSEWSFARCNNITLCLKKTPKTLYVKLKMVCVNLI